MIHHRNESVDFDGMMKDISHGKTIPVSRKNLQLHSHPKRDMSGSKHKHDTIYKILDIKRKKEGRSLDHHMKPCLLEQPPFHHQIFVKVITRISTLLRG